jgi:hypothetical protein
VAELPFAIAVGAFHNDHAYWHPMSLVAEYRYGRRAVLGAPRTAAQAPIIEQIEEHHSACGYRAGSIWNRGFSSVTPIPTRKFNRIGIEHGTSRQLRSLSVAMTGRIERPA